MVHNFVDKTCLGRSVYSKYDRQSRKPSLLTLLERYIFFFQCQLYFLCLMVRAGRKRQVVSFNAPISEQLRFNYKRSICDKSNNADYSLKDCSSLVGESSSPTQVQGSRAIFSDTGVKMECGLKYQRQSKMYRRQPSG